MLLNTADAVYVGDTAADAVYLGDTLVWSSGTGSDYADRILSLNPLSYWRLGEAEYGAGAVDMAGLYGCSWTGNPTIGVAGLLTADADTAMEVFGIVNQGASAGNPVEYQVDTVTLEAWVQTSNAGASYRAIVAKQDAYSLFAVDNVLTVYEWGTSTAITSGVNIADGQRHHVVAVLQPGSGSQLYLDGVAVGATFGHSAANQYNALTIGYAAYAGQEFSGVIDEVAIYGYALSAADIRANYEMGTLGAFRPTDVPGLLVWFDPAQDLYADGEKILSYREHSSEQREFITDGINGPIFHAGGSPYIEWPSTHVGFHCDGINAGLEGVTQVWVGDGYLGNYDMMLVHGPDSDGVEMRFSNSTTENVVRYTASAVVFTNTAPHVLGQWNLHVLRITYGVKNESWVGSALVSDPRGVPPYNVPLTQWVARREGGYYHVGKMAEALVYAGPLSDADLVKLRDYLSRKHSIPA